MPFSVLRVLGTDPLGSRWGLHSLSGQLLGQCSWWATGSLVVGTATVEPFAFGPGVGVHTCSGKGGVTAGGRDCLTSYPSAVSSAAFSHSRPLCTVLMQGPGELQLCGGWSRQQATGCWEELAG